MGKMKDIAIELVESDQNIEDLYKVVDLLNEKEYFMFLDIAELTFLSKPQENFIMGLHFKYVTNRHNND